MRHRREEDSRARRVAWQANTSAGPPVDATGDRRAPADALWPLAARRGPNSAGAETGGLEGGPFGGGRLGQRHGSPWLRREHNALRETRASGANHFGPVATTTTRRCPLRP